MWFMLDRMRSCRRGGPALSLGLSRLGDLCLPSRGLSCASYSREAMKSTATPSRLNRASSAVTPQARHPGRTGTSAKYMSSVSSHGALSVIREPVPLRSAPLTGDAIKHDMKIPHEPAIGASQGGNSEHSLPATSKARPKKKSKSAAGRAM